MESGEGAPPAARPAVLPSGCLALEVRPPVSLPDNCKTPGQYIRIRRIERGLRQVDLASIVGVHEGTVRVWERGKKYPRREHWEKLIEVLNLSPEIVGELLLEATLDDCSGHLRLALLDRR